MFRGIIIKEQEIIKSSKKIYHSLGDDLSRYIFKEWLLYSFTSDIVHMQNVIRTAEVGKWLSEFIESNDEGYLFSAGILGKG